MGDKRRDVEVAIFNGVAREEGATLGHAPACPNNRSRTTTCMNEQKKRHAESGTRVYIIYTTLEKRIPIYATASNIIQ
jgi:hypothetical protein